MVCVYRRLHQIDTSAIKNKVFLFPSVFDPRTREETSSFAIAAINHFEKVSDRETIDFSAQERRRKKNREALWGRKKIVPSLSILGRQTHPVEIATGRVYAINNFPPPRLILPGWKTIKANFAEETFLSLSPDKESNISFCGSFPQLYFWSLFKFTILSFLSLPENGFAIPAKPWKGSRSELICRENMIFQIQIPLLHLKWSGKPKPSSSPILLLLLLRPSSSFCSSQIYTSNCWRLFGAWFQNCFTLY